MKLTNYTIFRKMRTGRLNDVLLYLLFWALYGPLAVGLWYHERGSLLKLSIVLLIGLGAILCVLVVKEKIPKPKTQLKLPPKTPEFEGFRRLFSQSKHQEVVQNE